MLFVSELAETLREIRILYNPSGEDVHAYTAIGISVCVLRLDCHHGSKPVYIDCRSVFEIDVNKRVAYSGRPLGYLGSSFIHGATVCYGDLESKVSCLKM